MTRETLRDKIRKKLAETTAAFWTDAELNEDMENAQADIAWRAKCNRQRSLCSTTASTARYTLSSLISDCLRIYKVKVYNASTTDWDIVRYKTYEFLDSQYPGWETADAATPQYYTYDTDVDEFILYPQADSDHVGSNYIEIYNTPIPTAMSTDATSADLPTILHPAIIEYVVATELESRGYQTIADNHWTKYYGMCTSYINEKRNEEDEEIIMRPSR